MSKRRVVMFLARTLGSQMQRHHGEEIEVKGKDPYIPEDSGLIYPVNQQVTRLPPKPYKKTMATCLA